MSNEIESILNELDELSNTITELYAKVAQLDIVETTEARRFFPKVGDHILVWDDGNDVADLSIRIFAAYVEGKDYPWIDNQDTCWKQAGPDPLQVKADNYQETLRTMGSFSGDPLLTLEDSVVIANNVLTKYEHT